MKILLFAILLSSTLYTLHAQEALARIEYGYAESAFQNQQYEEALQHLDKVKELLGSSNQRVMYLEIMCYADSLGMGKQAKVDSLLLSIDTDILHSFDNLCATYIQGFGSSSPIEKLQQVYNLHTILDGSFSETTHFKQAVLYIKEKDIANALSEFRQSCALGNSKACEYIEYYEPIQEIVDNLVFVEGGSFYMGCDDPNCEKNEKPVHKVTLDDFQIGKYEVTQKQFLAVAKLSHIITYNYENNYGHKFTSKAQQINMDIAFKNPNCPECPVESITGYQMYLFINQIDEILGMRFEYPTEAQWEFAARGGIKSEGYQYAGSNNPNEVANYNSDNTQPVGQLQPNELGLYDMSGNVSEICRDLYTQYPEKDLTNPLLSTKPSEYRYTVKKSALRKNQIGVFGTSSLSDLPQKDRKKGVILGENTIKRGGDWITQEVTTLRNTNRQMTSHTTPYANLGFRLVVNNPGTKFSAY